ncbi:SDR family oxidoreductase [Humibacter sp. RRB41]|uniref:SDR family oxidoreductase n=1 Tax=Humibacter sp. RRB41 TaxID=2919946 RepID=UPI001FAA17B0|nr:SDR family oxidoreductase [Humibacter sp. RRB41]
MAISLGDSKVVVVGRGSGIARAIALAASAAGADVIVAGRHPDDLDDAYRSEGFRAERVDLNDEGSVAALADRLGRVDHIVSTASARARGDLRDLDRDAVRLSFDTKVVGPLMLAKHFADRFNPGGSLTIFSGVAAFKVATGFLGVAITNGAADTLARSLALEMAPVRVNAVSPGVIDTGAWDGLGEQGKADYFEHFRTHNPARRIGSADDVAEAVLFAMTNEFLTGANLHVDGGEPLT